MAEKKLIQNNGPKILMLAIILYLVIFSWFSIWKYQNFQYNAMDLGIINQVFFNSTQGQWLVSSIHPPSYLGDHFTPILFLLLPFYWLFQNPQTLLIIQTICLALSAWPVYLIAQKNLGINWALFFGLAWLLNPVVQNANLFEFHFLTLSVFFIFWVFYFYQQKRFGYFIIAIILAMLIREDVSLAIIMFGLLAMIDKRSAKWKITPIILGLGYFFGAMMITKYFAPTESYKFLIYYPWLKTIFTNPLEGLLYLLRFNNLIYFIGLLMPLLFTALAAPNYLILGLGNFLQLAMGSSGGSETLLQTHYSSLILPAIFVASIFGIKKIVANQKKFKLINDYQTLAKIILAVSIIYSSLALGPSIGMAKSLSIKESENKIIKKMINQIPDDAPAASSYKFLAALSSRPELYSINYAFLQRQQFLSQNYQLPTNTKYLIFDFNDLLTYQLQYENNPFYRQTYQTVRPSFKNLFNGFGLVDITDTHSLWQKDYSPQKKLIMIVDDQTPIQHPANQTLTDNLTFLGWNKPNDYYQFFWLVKNHLSPNYYLKITDKKFPLFYGLIDKVEQPTIIQMNYWPGEKMPRHQIELIEVLNGGIEIDEIRSTKNVIDRENILGVINL
ncbi:MAG: DUF2079 domain-containing protein [Patescibacteria group bacterium]|nr:DUF2079 domain-containing protein [Patescibacteria group bacterium]